jgi:hypothetical protein
LNLVPDEQVERHSLIIELNEKGYDDKRIAQYLNEKNIKTPRGKDYYPKLVWATRKKIRDRQERKTRDKDQFQILNMRFYLSEIPRKE